MQRYDLVYTDKMSRAKRALILACLNLRHGKRRLQKGRAVAGVSALYDALLFGMHYFVADAERHNRTIYASNDELWDYAVLYQKLVKAGIFEDPYAFNRLTLIVERALWQGSLSFDTDIILKEIEKMLTQIGVLNKIPPDFAPHAKQKSLERR
jgi:hypothetical protein